MPIRKVKGGFKWGQHGHVYPTRAGAAKQAQAAYAHGYVGKQAGVLVPVPTQAQQKQLTRRKIKQKRFSEAGAVLGAAALATKVPSYAAAAGRRFPKAKPLVRLGAAAPKADAISEHIVPVSLGIGSLGAVNFARLQGQEAKVPQQQMVPTKLRKGMLHAKKLKHLKLSDLSDMQTKVTNKQGHGGRVGDKVRKDRFLDQHRNRISQGAEDAYTDLGQRKRRRYGDAAAHGIAGSTLAGLAGALASHGRTRPLTSAAAAAAAGTPFLVSGYNRIDEGRSLQARRNKIKAKAYERAAQGIYGRPLKDVRKAAGFGMPSPRAGGLVHTISGKIITRRGAMPGTVPVRLPGALKPTKPVKPLTPPPLLGARRV